MDENFEENEDEGYLKELTTESVEKQKPGEVQPGEQCKVFKICIFYNKVRMHHKSGEETLHCVIKITTLDRFQTKALWIGNICLCEVIKSARSRGEDIPYHAACKKQLESTNESVSVSQETKTDCHIKWQCNTKVLDRVCNFIEGNVVQNKNWILF